MGFRSRVVEAISDVIAPGLSGRGVRDDFPSVSREIYDDYARAVARGYGEEVLSIEELESVVSRAPDFADAWAYLGARRMLVGHNSQPPHVMVPLASEAMSKALELEPNHPMPWGFFAHVAYDYEFDWEKADSLFRIALEYGGSDGPTLQTYGSLSHGDRTVRGSRRLHASGSRKSSRWPAFGTPPWRGPCGQAAIGSGL